MSDITELTLLCIPTETMLEGRRTSKLNVSLCFQASVPIHNDEGLTLNGTRDIPTNIVCFIHGDTARECDVTSGMKFTASLVSCFHCKSHTRKICSYKFLTKQGTLKTKF
jgi:hypothetical protein